MLVNHPSNIVHPALLQVQIAHCRSDITMAKQLHNLAQLDTFLCQSASERMAKGMESYLAVRPQFLGPRL